MCKCSKECCKKIPIKRYFLPLVGCVALTGYGEIRTTVYFPIFITLASFIIFWNFPTLAYMSASKPVYYQDIFIDEKKLPNHNVKKSVRKKFECIFLISVIITNSLLAGALAEYWLFQSKDTKTYIEIIGMSGGIIKLFQLINNIIGRIIIKILKDCIKNENIRMQIQERKSIENILKLKRVRFSHDNLSDLETKHIKSESNLKKDIEFPIITRPRSDTL